MGDFSGHGGSQKTWSEDLGWWSDRDINGDLMVINPLVMEYEWLVGVLEHEFYDFPNSWDDDPIWRADFSGG